MRAPKIELYSNEHVNKSFFIVKSFKIIYLIEYYKNTFYNKFFLYVYSFLQMELYFLGLVKNHGQVSALGCLESVANKKGVYLKKCNS